MEASNNTNKSIIDLVQHISKIAKTLESYQADIKQVGNLNTSFAKELLQSTSATLTNFSGISGDLSDLSANASAMLKNVDTSDSLIRHSIDASLNNLEVLKKVYNTISGLTSQFQIIKRIITDMSESISGIGKRVNVIDDISSLTNLLALNAAIEAARAGESGRGFSVVAKEIRALADRSRINTDDISVQLSRLTEQVKISLQGILDYESLQTDSLQSLKETTDQISTTMNTLGGAKESLEEIESIFSKQSKQITGIATQMETVTGDAEHLDRSSRYIISSLTSQHNTLLEMDNQVQKQKISLADLSSEITEKTEHRQDSQTHIIGHDTAYPPWAYISAGSSHGISVEIFKKIIKKMGCACDFLPDQWNTLFPLLLEKKIACLLNVGWPNSFFDDKPVIASIPYSSFKVRLFMHKDFIQSRGFSLSDLAGKRIAVQKGSYIDQLLLRHGCEIVHFENDIQGMVSHIWNKVYAVATEAEVGKYLSNKYFQGDLHPITDSLGELDVVLLFEKENTEFCEAVNTVISSLRSEKELTNTEV